MPHFHFHIASAGAYRVDEDGIDFDSLDEAYLEACRAALEISFQMLRSREDPNGHRFEIADEAGVVVMEIPFREVLRPGRAGGPRPPVDKTWDMFAAGLSRNRALRLDLAHQIVAAKRNVEVARWLLSRARAES